MALCFSLCGALRFSEVYGLMPQDVQINGEEIDVVINYTKTHQPRQFKIVNAGRFLPVTIIKKYDEKAAKRTAYFVQIRHNKCKAQRVGRNTIADYCKNIATYLKLPTPEVFTSHSMRRTSSTLLAKNGATKQQLKNVRGWRNMKTINGYINTQKRCPM